MTFAQAKRIKMEKISRNKTLCFLTIHTYLCLFAKHDGCYILFYKQCYCYCYDLFNQKRLDYDADMGGDGWMDESIFLIFLLKH